MENIRVWDPVMENAVMFLYWEGLVRHIVHIKEDQFRTKPNIMVGGPVQNLAKYCRFLIL